MRTPDDCPTCRGGGFVLDERGQPLLKWGAHLRCPTCAEARADFARLALANAKRLISTLAEWDMYDREGNRFQLATTHGRELNYHGSPVERAPACTVTVPEATARGCTDPW